MRYLHTVTIAIALWAPGPSMMFGQSSALSIAPNPASYPLVSQTFVTRSQSYYTYQAIIVNTGPALAGATATATSLSPNITVVPGQGTLQFAPVPSNTPTTSTNTFTILTSGGVQFDGSQIAWSFNSPFANPGPAQTVPVLSTVTLNGGGSTNPSGIGSLTYSWSIQSAPAGSTATLSNANSVTATFKPDFVGAYTIALTVSNGSLSNTATVAISTTDAPPTASAGPNQTVAVGSMVSLNGTKSFDLNNQPLAYTWSLISAPPNSVATIFGLRSPIASLVADVPGTYIVGLVVNDGTLKSAMSTATISTGNTAPVAVATATPQFAVINGLVQLDGSKSTDVDGNPLTYMWSLNKTQAPGSKAALSNPNIVNPTFTVDVMGTYIAQLIVEDGTTPSQPVTVSVSTNAAPPPTANAGPNQKVAVGSTVHLQGSGSDSQNLPLNYIWSLPTVPPGSAASLSATNVQNPTFVADLPGTYAAQLIVSNGTLTSPPSLVTITSTVAPPVAVPTTSTPIVAVGSLALLSGASSFDPDNDPITAYMWSLSVPAGSNASLRGANGEFPSFVADIPGTYVAQLIVKDAFATSVPATVSISAGSMGITMSPNPLTLGQDPETLTITLSPGAGPEPIDVTLSGYDQSLISLPSNPVTIPANSSSAKITVMPVTLGSTSITASAPGYQSSSIPVNIITPTITVAFQNNLTSIAVGQTISATITLSSPAGQPFGTTVTLVDLQDHDAFNVPGLVTFSSPSVLIPGGSTTGTFTITGAIPGSIEILPGSPGYSRVHVIFFTVTPN
jgi:hypothetical protein